MRIVIASPIDESALSTLADRHDVVMAIGTRASRLIERVGDREALVFRSGVDVSRNLLRAAPELRLLIRAGSGLDNVDLDEVARRRIVLHRVPGPGAQAVAEMTFALMLAVARRIVVADRLLREGHWAKSELVGHNLTGKTLGVIGLGAIGDRVAHLGLAWGMRVMGAVEHYTLHRRDEFAARGIELARLDRVLREADFVTVHVPLTDRTESLIDRRALELMKPGSFLVNISRGGVVDEHALRDALATERLSGAALDVHVAEGEGAISPLVGFPNVVLTPHIGASTVDAQREIGQEVVRIIDSFTATRSTVPSSGTETAPGDDPNREFDGPT